jgi:hypothetical protein
VVSLYRLHIRPYGGAGNVEKSVAFCLENSVIGMGWCVPNETTIQSDDFAWFEAAAKEQYGADGSWSSVRRLAQAETGDLVWFRDLKGHYYLAEITGPWRYRYDDPVRIAADVVNYRPAKISPVGLADAVPGNIVSCFSPARTLQRITKPGMLAFSCGLLGLPQPDDRLMDLYDFMTPLEIEDLVLVYLQANGWLVLLSTRTSHTAYYECVLVHGITGERAIVQVKSGNTHLNASGYSGTERVFLFAASGTYGEEHPDNVTIITRAELEKFMGRYPHLLSGSVTKWREIGSPRPS